MANFVANPQVSGYSVAGKGRRAKGHLVAAFALFFTLSPAPFAFCQTKKARQLYDQSIKLFGERKATEAVPFMEQAIKEDPTFTDAYLRLGQLYEFLKRYDPALAAYRNVIRLQPDSPGAGGGVSGAEQYVIAAGPVQRSPAVSRKIPNVFCRAVNAG